MVQTRGIPHFISQACLIIFGYPAHSLVIWNSQGTLSKDSGISFYRSKGCSISITLSEPKLKMST